MQLLTANRIKKEDASVAYLFVTVLCISSTVTFVHALGL